MKDFERLLNNLNKLDIDDIFFQLWSDSKVEQYIIKLNTKGESTSQLYNFGINSDGQSIGEYSDYTIAVKSFDGQPTDRVTLYDTGEFYESFVVKPLKKGYKITANPNKEDSNLFQDWGENIVGLTDENTELLLAFIEKDFEKELEKRLFK
jgi:hypothetical protein